jgi:hypothetical protein
MLEGTLSGLQSAYEAFDEGIACSQSVHSAPADSVSVTPSAFDFVDIRELIFLRALTQTAMLVIRDDGGSTDSVLELAREFGIELLGDSMVLSELKVNYPVNQHDSYEIPAGAPAATEVSNLIGTWMIPEIEEILKDLDSISDSPEHPFRTFFRPSLTGLEKDLEVDYGELLILKAGLTLMKGLLEARAAYDISVSEDEKLAEEIYGSSFSIDDFLDEYPFLLKILPTINDPYDGAALLAQAAHDLIEAMDYYLAVTDYIRSEQDPQDDDLLYIDPNDDSTLDKINDRLLALRNSLADDTAATVPWKTTKRYTLADTDSATELELELVSDTIGLDAGGRLAVAGAGGIPSAWEITHSEIEGQELFAEMEHDVPGSLGGGLLVGTLSEDGASITNGTFEYWGPENGTISNLSGRLVSTMVEAKQLDLNPVFGSSDRYAKAVNPRDLLPEFNRLNKPDPDTFGKGLGYDATLGGILPGTTQQSWNKWLDLEPAGSPPVGTIGGTVSYDAWQNSPIFVQAYTDVDDPQGSVVGSTMIAEPGPYTLEGISPGWQGYVRAFTPLFGFNLFDVDALAVESRIAVYLADRTLSGVDLSLSNPVVLEQAVWASGETDAVTRNPDWYAFDAVAGDTYALDLTRGTADNACLTLYGRNGHTQLQKLSHLQTQHVEWTCPVSGTYYVTVTDADWQPDAGTYQIRTTSVAGTCWDLNECAGQPLGDLTCNGRIDFHDLGALKVSFSKSEGQSGYNCCADFNHDDSVDFLDLAIVKSNLFTGSHSPATGKQSCPP